MASGGEHIASDPGPARLAARAELVRLAVRQFEKALTGYAAHLLGGDVERAREVVQEAFFRLCAEPPERAEAHVKEWLYTVCRNLASDVRRKERRMQLMGQTPTQYAQRDEGPAEAVERNDTYSYVLAALDTLSTNQQEVVRLKFQHGLSYKQISEVTHLTVTNVGFLLHTALKTLRERMGEEKRVQGRSEAEIPARRGSGFSEQNRSVWPG